MSYMDHTAFADVGGILEMSFDEVEQVDGGTGEATPPNCTTSGSTTTCTCPAGTRLAAGSDKNIMLMSCVTVS